MIRFFRYDLNSEFEGNKETLNKLDNYVALTEDNQMVHYKPLPNIFYVTTNNTGTTIVKRTDNAGNSKKITLENGENKLTDWNYGFYFNPFNMNTDQITSFDLSNYDTSNVTDMSSMFYQCSGLTSLDLSNFDTSKVTNMSEMFRNCSGLTSLDLSNFDTSNVTDMSYIFRNCSGLTSLDVSSFDTSKVTDIQNIFYGCTNLTSLDLNKFDTSNVTTISNMFYDCNKLTHIKCTKLFKNWCWTKQDTIKLPTAMRDGGNGNWEIV